MLWCIQGKLLYGYHGELLQIEVALNTLCPHSDENEIFLYIIITFSNSQVIRIKKVITKEEIA